MGTGYLLLYLWGDGVKCGGSSSSPCAASASWYYGDYSISGAGRPSVLPRCHAADVESLRGERWGRWEAFAIAMLQHTLQSRSRLACFEAAAVLAYTEPYYHCFSSSSPSSDSATTTSPTTSPVQSSPPLPLTPT